MTNRRTELFGDDLDNSPAVLQAHAQFGQSKLHDRGIDEMRYRISELNRKPAKASALPTITECDRLIGNKIASKVNDNREMGIEGGQGREGFEVESYGNAIVGLLWGSIFTAALVACVACVKGCV